MSEIKCPKCGSTQITASKKGFSGKKAVAGAVLTGGIGLLAGTIGSNKVRITCLACGNVFAPGDHARAEAARERNEEQEKTLWLALPANAGSRDALPEFEQKLLVVAEKEGSARASIMLQDERSVSGEVARKFVQRLCNQYGVTPKPVSGLGIVVLLVAGICLYVLMKAC